MRKVIGVLLIVFAMIFATPMIVGIFSPDASRDALKFYASLTIFFAWENVAIFVIIALILIFWDDLTAPKRFG